MIPLLWVEVAAGFVVLIALLVEPRVRYVRLHHPWSNRRFLRRYRGTRPADLHEHLQNSWSSPAPAGSARRRHIR